MVYIKHRARPATLKNVWFFRLQTLKTPLSFTKKNPPRTRGNKISPPPPPLTTLLVAPLASCDAVK